VLHPVGRGRRIKSSSELLNMVEMERLVTLIHRMVKGDPALMRAA
jgi:hypothetical protein